MRLLSLLKARFSQLSSIDSRLHNIQEAVGRIESRQLADFNNSELAKNEFRVYSQWGEDGIIQHLLRHVNVEKKMFVEFGVENYTESNTRFLLVNNNWSGLVIDDSEKNITYIKNDPIYWQHNLKAENAFITKDNINDLLVKNGVTGDIGLLSVDIDGNDYWLWDAIHVINPAIVIVEYNSLFGPKTKVSTPYDAAFQRTKAHYSNLYFGASLAALCSLAEHKGYAFVGSNSSGCNVFFVKRELISSVPIVSPEKGYVPISARQSRNKNGALNYLSFQASQNLIRTMPVFDFENGEMSLFNDVLNRINSDVQYDKFDAGSI